MKILRGIIAVVLVTLVSLVGCASGPSCGTITGGSGTPSLVFTRVPKIGTADSLQGQEMHVAPAESFVAVYIHVGSGWWTKPTFSEPETTINCDGSWTTDITTGGNDTQADTIVAFLFPIGFTPPQLGGEATLPQELYTDSLATVSVTR